MMFYKKTYKKKEDSAKDYKKTDEPSPDLLEELGDTVERVRRDSLKVVGQVISQRCLETGVSEMVLLVDKEERQKEKMVKFISVIEESGLSLTEPDRYKPTSPHITHTWVVPKSKVKPWTVPEPENTA